MKIKRILDVGDRIIVYVFEMNEVLLDLVVSWSLPFGKISLKVGVAADFLFLLVRSPVCYKDIWISKKLRLNLYFRS